MGDNKMHVSDTQLIGNNNEGCINNAGRFRAEYILPQSIRTKNSSSTNTEICSFDSSTRSKYFLSQETDNSCFSPDCETSTTYSTLSNKPDDALIETIDLIGSDQSKPKSLNSDSIGPCRPITTRNFTNPSGLVNDYFLFDPTPCGFYSPSGNTAKQFSTPLHLENPERETRWYFKYFLGKNHQVYCGLVTERDPFLLAVAKDDVQTYGISQYRAILWRKTGSQKLCISYNPTNSLTAKKVLNFFDIHRVEKGPKEILNFEVQKEALTLEEQEGSVNFKFGVLYCIEGQTSDQEMYNNEHGSEEFDKFVNLLGDRIGLKSWDRFKGGLDTKTDTTGINSVYTIYEGHEIMFHVSTLLPFSTENQQQIERKRHVGNDIVNIIFVDKCPPGTYPSWTPSMMRTHFTHIFAIVTHDQENELYRLNVFAEESVPIFGPSLPNPPEFKNPQEFREFLLVKLINGEKAAFHSPVFAQKRERTLEMLLTSICSTYTSDTSGGTTYRRAFSDVVVDSFNGITTSKEQSRNETYIRYGQMLKLNTIIRGDAPTSSITSGQSKKNPWQPKLIHTCLQHEVICGDVWGNQLIVSTEQGTFILKEHESPNLLIDRMMEIKQLEVVEQAEVFVIRYDKGREAKVAVIPLKYVEPVQLIDRNQVKKLSLEKTRGSQLFSLSKSNSYPVKLAVAVHRRILIFQWHMFTGRSLSSWNQFAQSNAMENFQFIREIHMVEPVHTVSFVEGIPGGRLCIGHRNQFTLIDERTKESMQLFRTEGSRNQVVSALELWADEEQELLLCFARTCHFHRINTIFTAPSSRRLNLSSSSPLEKSCSGTTVRYNTETINTMTKSTSTLVQIAGFSSPDSSNSSPGPMARSCSPDPPFASLSTISPLEEKTKTGEFDFVWNFEPQQVAVCFPYIFGFNPSAIEIRLLINGSLVHTMLVSECRLIASKGDIYFTSTSETLDYDSGLTGSGGNFRTQNESPSVTKSPDPSNSSDDNQNSPTNDICESQNNTSITSQVDGNTLSMNKDSNTSSNSKLMSSTSCTGPTLNMANSSTSNSGELPVPQPHYIYRIPIYSMNRGACSTLSTSK